MPGSGDSEGAHAAGDFEDELGVVGALHATLATRMAAIGQDFQDFPASRWEVARMGVERFGDVAARLPRAPGWFQLPYDDRPGGVLVFLEPAASTVVLGLEPEALERPAGRALLARWRRFLGMQYVATWLPIARFHVAEAKEGPDGALPGLPGVGVTTPMLVTTFTVGRPEDGKSAARIVLAVPAFQLVGAKPSPTSPLVVEEDLDEEDEDDEDPEVFRSRIIAEPIALHLGAELLALDDPARGGDLANRLISLRLAIGLDTGFVAPPIELAHDPDLGPTAFRLLFRGVEVTAGTCPDDRPIEDRVAELAIVLEKQVRVHAHVLLTLEETRLMLDKVAERAPGAVQRLVPARLELHELHRVLASLLEAGVSIRNLTGIVEHLLALTATTRDPLALAERLRTACLPREVMAPLARGTQIAGVAFAPRAVRGLLLAARWDDAGPRLDLPPWRAWALARDMRAAVGPDDDAPIFLCAAAVRPHLQRFARALWPGARVIATSEVLAPMTLHATAEVPWPGATARLVAWLSGEARHGDIGPAAPAQPTEPGRPGATPDGVATGANLAGPPAASLPDNPFTFLEALAPPLVADLLAQERPGTSAGILAMLDAGFAGAVLAALPPELRDHFQERIQSQRPMPVFQQRVIGAQLRRRLGLS